MECYRRGFIWAKEGVRYMENFSENRDHYPSFSDFMPQLVGLMEGVADNIEAIKKDFYTPPPVYRHRISREWFYSVSRHFGNRFPFLSTDGNREYRKDEYTYVIRVGKKLESGKKYGIVIPSALYNKNGINTDDNYVYEFYVK